MREERVELTAKQLGTPQLRWCIRQVLRATAPDLVIEHASAPGHLHQGREPFEIVVRGAGPAVQNDERRQFAVTELADHPIPRPTSLPTNDPFAHKLKLHGLPMTGQTSNRHDGSRHRDVERRNGRYDSSARPWTTQALRGSAATKGASSASARASTSSAEAPARRPA